MASGFIDPAFVEKLLVKLDIVDLIEAKIKLKKAGNNYQACCPFHNEKTPSFVVFPRNQNYHCFGCGVHGDAINFIRDLEGLTYVEAIKYLADFVGEPIPTNSVSQGSNTHHLDGSLKCLSAVGDFYYLQLSQNPIRERAVNYLKQRGITGKIAKHFKIGFAPPGWDNLVKHFDKGNLSMNEALKLGLIKQSDKGRRFDMFRDRIMFPIRNRRGQIIGFGGRVISGDGPKYLNSSESELFHKSKELYGLYEARQANRHLERLLVVEGYMDVIALAQYGISNAVATLGTALTKDHLNIIFKYTNEVVFCFDGDKAGEAAAVKTLAQVLPSMEDGLKVKYLFLPQGEDPDSLIRSQGEVAFSSLIRTATPLSEFLVTHLIQKLPDRSIDSKARVLNEAKELLQLIPKTAFKQMLAGQLAQALGIDIALIIGRKKFTNNQKVQGATTAGMHSLALRALAILVQLPQLAKQLSDYQWLKQMNDADSVHLHSLLEQLKTNTSADFLETLPQFGSQSVRKQLFELKKSMQGLSESALATEFFDAISRLQRTWQGKLTETLIAKAKAQGLTSDEKQSLAQLLLQQKKES